jgi:GR25 family glycosyltransferase involved in LPS biosynthesis
MESLGMIIGEKLTESAVVINMKCRPERLKRFYESHDPIFGAGNIRRHEACTPQSHPKPSFYTLTPGHYACASSLLEVLRIALADRIESLLIFEDDNICGPLANAMLFKMMPLLPEESVLWYCVDNPIWSESTLANGVLRRLACGWRTDCLLFPSKWSIRRVYDHFCYHMQESTQADEKLSCLAEKELLFAPTQKVTSQDRSFPSDTYHRELPLDEFPIERNERLLYGMLCGL